MNTGDTKPLYTRAKIDDELLEDYEYTMGCSLFDDNMQVPEPTEKERAFLEDAEQSIAPSGLFLCYYFYICWEKRVACMHLRNFL